MYNILNAYATSAQWQKHAQNDHWLHIVIPAYDFNAAQNIAVNIGYQNHDLYHIGSF